LIYKEGGELDSPINTGRDAVIAEARGSGRFVELPIASKLPDGGVAHVLANVSPGTHARSSAFLAAGLENVRDCKVTFDERLQLTGLSAVTTPDTLEVTYRWRCLRPVQRDYWCFTHILDSKGAIAGYLDHQILAGDPPTTAWKPGDSAIEKLTFRLTGQNAGPYRLRLGVFDRASGDRLHISASEFPLADDGTSTVVSR